MSAPYHNALPVHSLYPLPCSFFSYSFFLLLYVNADRPVQDTQWYSWIMLSPICVMKLKRLLSMPRVWHAFQSHLILLSLTWCSTRSLWFSICLSGYMTPESKSFQKKLVGSAQPCPPTKTTFSLPVSRIIHRLPHPPHSLLSVCISLWHILCGSPLHCHWRATVSPDFFCRSPLNLIPPLTDHPDVVGTRLYPRCHSSDAGLY